MPIPELIKFKECIAKHFIITDWQAIDIVVAAAVAHKLGGEMLWLRIIGASGSGKTEILRTLTTQKGYVETLETLTPSAIRRGFKPMRRNKETDKLEPMITEQTLLQRMNGHLVITKELAPLLTKQHEARNEIFGLLRSLHDGELDADYGSFEGHIKQKCCFDWIIGTTGLVDSENQLEGQLGTRFTDLRWSSPEDTKSVISKAVSNVGGMEQIREELSNTMAAIIARSESKIADKFYEEYISTSEYEHFLELCRILATLRTNVIRDRYTKDVQERPMPESGTRIGQAFSKIAKGLLMLGYSIHDINPYIVRMTWDGLPPNRAIVLRAIHEIDHDSEELIPDDSITDISQKAIADWSRTIEYRNGDGLSQQAVSLVLRDLKVLHSQKLSWRSHLFEAV